MGALVPFLRATDARASAAWWCGTLGFEVEWEHRFEPGLPLFVALRRGDDRLFLSEHEGDAPPAGLVYFYVEDVDAVAAAAGTTAADTPYGTRELELRDPDGNRVRVGTPTA